MHNKWTILHLEWEKIQLVVHSSRQKFRSRYSVLYFIHTSIFWSINSSVWLENQKKKYWVIGDVYYCVNSMDLHEFQVWSPPICLMTNYIWQWIGGLSVIFSYSFRELLFTVACFGSFHSPQVSHSLVYMIIITSSIKFYNYLGRVIYSKDTV